MMKHRMSALRARPVLRHDRLSSSTEDDYPSALTSSLSSRGIACPVTTVSSLPAAISLIPAQPAAGVRCVTGHWLGSDNALKNIRTLLKTNQHGGFDCPGCAWGESAETGPIKFCENGAKAVNWEATKRRVDASFFARHSVSQLREQS